jgi:hypothetical protein
MNRPWDESWEENGTDVDNEADFDWQDSDTEEED